MYGAHRIVDETYWVIFSLREGWRLGGFPVETDFQGEGFNM